VPFSRTETFADALAAHNQKTGVGTVVRVEPAPEERCGGRILPAEEAAPFSKAQRRENSSRGEMLPLD
jgi:hypothetical protein